MSGGHWDYSQHDLKSILKAVGQDPEVLSKWPRIAGAFSRLAPVLTGVMNDMDWDLSFDESVGNDAIFDARGVAAIREAVRVYSGNLDAPRLEQLEQRVKALEEKP